MRLATVCSGIGVAELAAADVWGDEHELVFACEIDKFARASFSANHTIAPGQFHISVDDNPLNLYKKSFPYTVDFYLKSTKKLTKAQKKYFQLDVPTLRTLRLIAKKVPKFSAFSNVLTDEFLERYKGLVDILVGGTPCQNFSLAGLRQGLEGKTGILIWEYFRIVKALMPPVFVWENVKGFISDKKGKTLKDFLEVFRSIGYHCHYQVVDTKDYGVPQHRERIYIVGFLDVDAYYRFSFAPKQKLTKRLKDVLETDVDEKYYLSAKMIDYFQKNSAKNRQKGNGFSFTPTSEENIAKTLTNPALNRMDETYVLVNQLNPNYKSQCNTIHNINKEFPTLCAGTHGYASGYIQENGVIGMLDIKGNEQNRRVYGVDGVAPTLNAMQGDMREPKIMVHSANCKGYEEACEGDSINLKNLKSKTRRGRIGKGVANALETSMQQVVFTPMIRQKSQSGVRYREDCGTLSATGNRADMTVVEPLIYDDYNGRFSQDGTAYSLTSKCGAGSRRSGQKVIEPKIFAMRGRNPDNPTSRKSGLPTVQCLEENAQGISNTLTTVQKDNLVSQMENRLRRLTPRECLRLQDIPDSFKQVISDSQLYKQAGNAKSRNVVIMLFRQIKRALKPTDYHRTSLFQF